VGHRATAGINPYALGFAMYTDIKRICERPPTKTALVPRHRRQRPWLPTLDHAMRNFKDESFIGQYLSPQADARLAPVRHPTTTRSESELEVSAIHDEAGYRRLREALSRQYDLGSASPTSRSGT
jgi:stage V sporulation protein R